MKYFRSQPPHKGSQLGSSENNSQFIQMRLMIISGISPASSAFAQPVDMGFIVRTTPARPCFARARKLSHTTLNLPK